MGDPRKARKKYKTPTHPWEKERIEAESKLMSGYGLKNKQEIQKMESLLRNMKAQAKRYIAAHTEQAEKERQQLLNKAQRQGLIDASGTLDDILGLTIEAILDRRLQTLLYRKGHSISIKSARQMITHRHVTVNGRKVTSPSMILSKDEGNSIAFDQTSSFLDPEHPERPQPKQMKEKILKEKPEPAKEA